MPDTDQVVPVVIGVAALMAIVACIVWMASHPVLIVSIVLVGAVGAVLLARRARARNRV
jgi:hypothetical protein